MGEIQNSGAKFKPETVTVTFWVSKLCLLKCAHKSHWVHAKARAGLFIYLVSSVIKKKGTLLTQQFLCNMWAVFSGHFPIAHNLNLSNWGTWQSPFSPLLVVQAVNKKKSISWINLDIQTEQELDMTNVPKIFILGVFLPHFTGY